MSQQPDNFNPHRDVTQSESGDCEVAAAGIVIYPGVGAGFPLLRGVGFWD